MAAILSIRTNSLARVGWQGRVCFNEIRDVVNVNQTETGSSSSSVSSAKAL